MLLKGQRTVLPANITVAPVWRDLSEMVELAGAEIPDNKMLVHDFTADEIEAYAVTVQVVPPLPPTVVVVVAFVVVVDF